MEASENKSEVQESSAESKNNDEPEKSQDKVAAKDSESERRERDELLKDALRNHRIKLEDAIDPNSARVIDLKPTDILFGRGKKYQNNPGNIRMRDIIASRRLEYGNLKRTKKWQMVEATYNEIVSNGARFLKKLEDENVWVNVAAPIALQKISHTFRSKRSKNEAAAAQARMFHMNHSANQGSAEVDASTSLQASINNFASNSNLAMSAPSEPLLGPQALHLTGLLGFTGMPNIPIVPSAATAPPTSMNYFNILQQEQQLRNSLYLQQLEEARRMNSARLLLQNQVLLQQFGLSNSTAIDRPETSSGGEEAPGGAGKEDKGNGGAGGIK